jgi:anti-sigma factor RsiW
MNLTCQRFDELLADGDVGGLRPDERLLFERHLVECAACARRLRELTLTTEILKGIWSHEEREPHAALREPLVQRILEARRATDAGQRVHRRA